MPKLIYLILLFILFYVTFCTLVATSVSLFKMLIKKEKFMPNFKSTFIFFLFEMFDPNYYF